MNTQRNEWRIFISVTMFHLCADIMATITSSSVLTVLCAISLSVLQLKGIGSEQTPSSKFYRHDGRFACVTDFDTSHIKPSNGGGNEAGSKSDYEKYTPVKSSCEDQLSTGALSRMIRSGKAAVEGILGGLNHWYYK